MEEERSQQTNYQIKHRKRRETMGWVSEWTSVMFVSLPLSVACVSRKCPWLPRVIPSLRASRMAQWERICLPQHEGSVPGSGRSPGGGNGNPLQYSCMENSMDGGAWRATVCGVAESDTIDHAHTHCTIQFRIYFCIDLQMFISYVNNS